MSDGSKFKHLELISGAISRMSQNSFSIKSWCVTLVSGLIALSIGQGDWRLALVGLVPITLLWIVDTYYLAQERRFRNVYDHVRAKDDCEIDFAMKYDELEPSSLIATAFSSFNFMLYGGLGLSIILVAILL